MLETADFKIHGTEICYKQVRIFFGKTGRKSEKWVNWMMEKEGSETWEARRQYAQTTSRPRFNFGPLKKHSKNHFHKTIRILEQNLINYYEVTRHTKTTKWSTTSLEANRGLNNSHCCFLSAPTETLYTCGLFYISRSRCEKHFTVTLQPVTSKEEQVFSCWITVCPLFLSSSARE